MRLAISIPVHEQPDVVHDQIRNIRRFVPDALVVLHVSRTFSYRGAEDVSKMQALADLEGVHVNPLQLPTAWGDIAYLHVANFKYLAGVETFDLFAIHASNDAFVQGGLADLAAPWYAGVKAMVLSDAWVHTRAARADQPLARMLAHLGRDEVVCAQAEGTFYRADLFREMVALIDAFYDYQAINAPLCREEVYFPTLALQMLDLAGGSETVLPHTYVYSGVVHAAELGPAQVDAIRSGALRDGELPYFAIKPVRREIDNPLRTYLRDLRDRQAEVTF